MAHMRLRHHRLLAAAILAAAAAVLTTSAYAAPAQLRFPVQPGGHVVYAVFSGAQSWQARTGAVAKGAVVVANGLAEVTLDLPPGQYAVMAFHDRNGDKRLNVLPIGLPTEPYGFSNDARAMFGPPTFAKAAFSLPASGAGVTISLR
jgi:uncharacterized protein (DUF2141 family)